jgi:phosphoglycerate dehydrogenase-like enzyme
MSVIAAEVAPDKDFLQQHAVELVEFDTLLNRSDYVSLHCPLNEHTQGLFDEAAFAKMKPGSVLINTARGKLVVEADLCRALESGHLKGAGMDVFEQEPPDIDNPLLKMDNVVLSPHMAGADEESSAAMAMEAAQCIVKLYRGEWPHESAVNSSLQDTWKW